MANYVYSTLTCDNHYTNYVSGPNDLPAVAATVHIKGGANVADKRVYTPRGVVTEVSDDHLELLLNNKVFQVHMKNGFITVETTKTDAEVAAANMESRDESAPLVPEDFKDFEEDTKGNLKAKKRK